MKKNETFFSCYPNVYAKKEEKRMTLAEISEWIKSNELASATAKIRQSMAEKHAKEAETLKMKLPVFAASVQCPGNRLTEEAGDYTGYVLVDIDGLKQPLAECLERCRRIKQVALAYVSARGQGIHLLFPVNTTKEQHKAACLALYDLVEGLLGEETDRKCTDLVRTSLICHDPDCYYNPDAEVFSVPETYFRKELPPIRYEFSTASERLGHYFDAAIRPGEWQRGQRHALLVRLVYSLNRAGFPESDVTSECLRRYIEPDFPEKEIRRIVSYVYARKQNEHGINRRNYTPYPPQNPSFRATCARCATSGPKNEQVPGEDTEDVVNKRVKKELSCFPNDVYMALPDMLQQMFRPGMSRREKDITLVGSLCMLSAAMPKVEGCYRKARVCPPFYCAIVAPPASGKGQINAIRPINKQWFDYVRANSQKEVQKYRHDMEVYEGARSKFRHGKLTECPVPPERVVQKELALAGDITKPKLVEQLAANGPYAALMHETEIGVLIAAIEQDYGKYTHLLNQVFHHEWIGNNTKIDGSHSAEYPQMAILLSGTFGQFARFIPTAEDGLFSRFLGYVIAEDSQWGDLTDSDDSPQTGNFYSRLSSLVLETALHLEEYPTFVHYTESQRKKVNRRFSQMLRHVQLFSDNELVSLVNRCGLIHFRIAMALTALRKAEEKRTDPEMTVREDDFETAFLIAQTGFRHMMVLSTLLKKDPNYTPPSDPSISEQLYNDLADEFRTVSAIERGVALGMTERTVKRTLTEWCKNGLTVRLSKGYYQKKKDEKPEW